MPKSVWSPTPHAKTIRNDNDNHLPERNAFIVTSVGRCHEIVSSSTIELDVYIRQSKVLLRGEFDITIFIISVVVLLWKY